VFPYDEPGLTFHLPIADYPFGPLHPFLDAAPLLDAPKEVLYDGFGPGHRNQLGLTRAGREYVRQLVASGMLLDMAHMSDQTVYDVLTDEGLGPDVPLLISHAHFRAMQETQSYVGLGGDFGSSSSVTAAVKDDLLSGAYSLTGLCASDPELTNVNCDPRVLRPAMRFAQEVSLPGTQSSGSVASEWGISSAELANVALRHGATGIFLDQPTARRGVEKDLPYNFLDTCGGSSTSFLAALLFAEKNGGETHFGIASDFSFTGALGPRFGPNACPNYQGEGLGSGAGILEVLLNPTGYQISAQQNRVPYCLTADIQESCLMPYTMGPRQFDFNEDGLANYGLLPDLLEDVTHLLANHAAPELNTLFRSAEGFLETWEAAEAVRVTDGAPRPASGWEIPSLGNRACGSACLSSFNRGAPLEEVGEPLPHGECRLGVAVRLRANAGNLDGPMFAVPSYSQRGTDVSIQPGDATEEGDWAIYPISPGQVWQCGTNGTQRPLNCPSSATFVKVRRTLDTTVSSFTDACNALALPPENGDRDVLFQCLAGEEFGPIKGPGGGDTTPPRRERAP
jgi:hypothetical protein